MRYILFILIFFACKAQGQIVIDNYANNQLATSFTNLTLGSNNFIAGRLYLIFVTTTKATTPETPTMSGTGQTWTQINTTATSVQRITAFRFYCTSNNTNDATVFVGPNQTSYVLNRYEVTGMINTGTNGSDAIVQSVTNSATGANPSITLAAISSSGNAVIAAFSNNVNPFGGTPESGWTGGVNNGTSLPSGGYSMFRTNTTDNTPTVTAASSDWLGIAVEIEGTARRRIIIDYLWLFFSTSCFWFKRKKNQYL